MMPWKALKILIIYLLIAFPIMATCLFLMVTCQASVGTYGFAADSAGRIYVGKYGVIAVYENGEKAGVMESMRRLTSRGYAFNIDEEDHFILSTGDFVYTLDLSGNVLSKRQDTYTEAYYELSHDADTFTDVYGTQYVKNEGGTIFRLKGGERTAVYRVPGIDIIVTILLALGGISMAAVVPVIIYHARKDEW